LDDFEPVLGGSPSLRGRPPRSGPCSPRSAWGPVCGMNCAPAS